MEALVLRFVRVLILVSSPPKKHMKSHCVIFVSQKYTTPFSQQIQTQASEMCMQLFLVL